MTTFKFAGLSLAIALAACGLQGTDNDKDKDEQASTERKAPTQVARGGYDDARTAAEPEATVTDGKLSLKLPDGVTQEMLGDRTAEMIAVQAMLDHTHHAPGVIDGFGGGNTDSAIRYFRETHGMSANGGVDAKFLQTLFDETGGDVFRTYTVTERDAKGPYEKLPEDFADQAKMDAMGYETPLEMLAERFHMDAEFLEALNPDADFGKVPPLQFIPIAEDCGIISELTQHLLEDACKVAATWPDDLYLSFNLSPVQLQDPALPTQINAILKKFEFLN